MSRMTTIVSGYMKFGKVFDWEQKKDGDKTDRKLFRGQLSYRDFTNGEWYDIDAVCFKDFGQNGGLVGWLENHMLAEDGPRTSKDGNTPIGGQAIELVGYIKPAKRKRKESVTLNLKGGKKKVIEVEVEVETFEFVITDAGFCPNSEGTKQTGSKKEELDFDDIDEDEIEGAEIVPDGDEDEEEKPAKKTSSKKTSTKKTPEKKETGDPEKDMPSDDDEDDDDEDFFKK